MEPYTKPKRCFVLDCMNDETTPAIRFHRLPADPTSRHAWLRFLSEVNTGRDRKYSNASIVICSAHFQPECIGNQGARLRKGSNPTLVNQKRVVSSTPPLSTELVPYANSKLDYWKLVISLNSKINAYEGKVTSLYKQIDLQQSRIRSYQQQLHVSHQREKRQEAGVKKRKSEGMTGTAAKKLKLQIGVANSTSAGIFLHEVYERLSHAPRSYSEYMKRFAYEMHYRSPSAYEFLRTTLDGALPASRTFRRWTKPLNTRPGILAASMQYLKEQQSESPHTLYYALIFDEIHIRQQIIMDGDKMSGYIDYGGLAPEPDGEKVARTALFFLVNQINGSRKLPVAYVLTDGFNGETLAEILRNVLIALHNADARVLTITSDGLPANFTAMELLGADLNPCSPTFKTWFSHPTGEYIIFILLDPCHMIKLIRNAFKSVGFIFNVNGKKIEWGFISKLNRLQEETGLKAANKLSVRHVRFESNKMKTRICVQTLSNSVSVAIRVCRQLGQRGFAESEDTEEFISTMNRLFDTLNSHVKGRGYSTPLAQSNYSLNKEWLESCVKYLLGLQIVVDRERTSILRTRKSTGFKGLIIGITSCLEIMEKIILNPDEALQYFPVYKSGQDHIEMYFGNIRGRHGNNNNPNILQLRYAVRDLLCIKIKDLVTGNCMPLEDLSTLVSPFSTLKRMISDSEDVDEEDTTEDDFSNFNLDSNMFLQNIVTYIAGFVVKKLCSRLSCALCICKLCPSDQERASLLLSEEFLLLASRDNGGLHKPSLPVIKICRHAEMSVRFWQEKGLRILSADSIVSTCVRNCASDGLVSDIDCGYINRGAIGDQNLYSLHGLDLVKHITIEYTKLRLHHIAKTTTLRIKPTSTRSIHTNAVQFGGH